MLTKRVPERLSGVILDLDGVILDTMKQWNCLGRVFLRECGIEPKTDLLDRLATMTLEDSPAFLHDEYHVKKSVREIETILKTRVKSFYSPYPRVKVGALATIKTLKQLNVKVALATTTPKEFAETALELSSMRMFFDGLFSCADMGFSEGKTSARIYDVALAFLNTPLEETIVVEDSFYAIQTAKNAGYYVVGFEDEEEFRNKKEILKVVDHYVENHDELQKWLVRCFSI